MQLGGIFDIIIVNYLPFQTADLLNAECTPTTFVEPLGNFHIQTATLDASWTLNSGFIILNTHIWLLAEKVFPTSEMQEICPHAA